MDRKRQIATLESLLSKTSIYKSKLFALRSDYSKQLLELQKCQTQIEIKDKLLSDTTSKIKGRSLSNTSINKQVKNLLNDAKVKNAIIDRLNSQLSTKNSQLDDKINSLNFIKKQLSANQQQIDKTKDDSNNKDEKILRLTEELSMLKKNKENVSLKILERFKNEKFFINKLKAKEQEIIRLKSIIELTIQRIEKISKSQPAN